MEAFHFTGRGEEGERGGRAEGSRDEKLTLFPCFLVANEDGNCYTFDMRNLTNIKCIHKGHVGPVMCLDYSPTGQEFATGSYDKTIRIFESRGGHSREIYHTKRMQRIFQVS